MRPVNAPQSTEIRVFETFAEILAVAPSPQVTGVDMPIAIWTCVAIAYEPDRKSWQMSVERLGALRVPCGEIDHEGTKDSKKTRLKPLSASV